MREESPRRDKLCAGEGADWSMQTCRLEHAWETEEGGKGQEKGDRNRDGGGHVEGKGGPCLDTQTGAYDAQSPSHRPAWLSALPQPVGAGPQGRRLLLCLCPQASTMCLIIASEQFDAE